MTISSGARLRQESRVVSGALSKQVYGSSWNVSMLIWMWRVLLEIYLLNKPSNYLLHGFDKKDRYRPKGLRHIQAKPLLIWYKHNPGHSPGQRNIPEGHRGILSVLFYYCGTRIQRAVQLLVASANINGTYLTVVHVVGSLSLEEDTLAMRLLVASTDGFLYIYNLDPSEGGETSLVKQYRLDGKTDLSEVVGLAQADGSNATSSPKPIDKTDSAQGKYELFMFCVYFKSCRIRHSFLSSADSKLAK
ncbi:WD repeat domain phosphoinositide-interacting protein 2 [Homalodisca vitripennis]|nr:WD repeat domain phosphoinositide-interacting protein 2 [Homalodisca vitripennis]